MADLPRAGCCNEPGPYSTHCTDTPGHHYSCYDAQDDSSWNDGWFDGPHHCDDPACPDLADPDPEETE